MSFPINNSEIYLGKNINEINKKDFLIERIEPYSNNGEKNFVCREKELIYFFNYRCRNLFVTTNSNYCITSIFLSTEGLIDQKVFSKMVEKYGMPHKMLKMSTLKKTEDIVEDDYIANKSIFEAANCSFDENPSIIIWNKQKYKILIKMDMIRYTSLVSFEQLN